MPLSLYDALHRDRIALNRQDIALIASQVLQALHFLHSRGENFGSSLTSRKVMLNGSNHVKLRRFGLEFVLKALATKQPSLSVPETNSFWKTQYDIPIIESAQLTTTDSVVPSVSVAEVYRNQGGVNSPTQDLYAFGMLLLEMCTSEKPSCEVYNRLSCADQKDPVFGQISRLALSCGRIKDDVGDADRKNVKFSDPDVEVSAQCFMKLLGAIQKENRTDDEMRLSSASFPSFLHADQYFLAREAQRVEQSLQIRDSKFEVATKRLSGVELELLEEQSNFEILVKQFDKCQQEKTQCIQANSFLEDKVHAMLLSNDVVQDKCGSLSMEVARQKQEFDRVLMTMEDHINHIFRLLSEKAVDRKEKQALLLEILKLKEERRRLQSDKAEVEAQRFALAAKAGGEKDALEDVEGRYKQTVYKWEQEQKARYKVERQYEALNSQLLRMEEERSIYSFELNHCPTGLMDPKYTAVLVIDLKMKEIQVLRDEIDAQIRREQDLQGEVAKHRNKCKELCEEQQQLQDVKAVMQSQQQALIDEIAVRSETEASLSEQLRVTQVQLQLLEEKIRDFEEEMERHAKKREDEECEEKAGKRQSLLGGRGKSWGTSSSHRRQHNFDSATSSCPLCNNNVKNAQIVDIVRSICEVRDGNVSNGLDEEERRDAETRILGLVKQLSMVLKEDESLKDDLPECNVLRTIVSIMKQFNQSLGIQLECHKCLSVVVFNHDRNRIILVAEGAVEVALEGMKQFALDAKLLEASCVLMTNLSHNCESNRKRILDAGGVDMILQTMQTFPQHLSIQKKSCWSLLTLAGSDYMCERIVERGGLGAIIAGMLNCPSDAQVQYYSSWALLNLVSGAPYLQRFARQEGVVEVAEAALACFPDHPGIQEKTRQVLQLVSCQ
uniref:Protein kinase domain-containing protein n=1 Tax=Globisporangium ultimum (strain ATCC 200006 / CBS 805.95 / DAOM BR144) TaxID=431595 RepID=K3WKK7_GLOUD